jgi:Putative MetA-pathway of phenol degradation
MSTKLTILLCLVLALLCPTVLGAQSPCPTLSQTQGPFPADNKLICTLPQLYGPLGLSVEGGANVTGVATLHSVLGFNMAFRQLVPAENNFLLSVNQTVAREVGVLPLVTPASVVGLVFDQSLGLFVLSNDSFGPIFSERASTIGKHRLAFGFSYQYMSLDSLDGVDLHSFPTLFIQGADFVGNPCNPITNAGECPGSTHDFITAVNRVDLKINQYTAFVAFGLTRHTDVSVALPVLSISMQSAADSAIVPNSSNQTGFLAFETPVNEIGRVCLSSPSQGFCSHALFFNSQHASGVGDVTIRLKTIVKSWEQAGLAGGLEVRIPTGDEKNFLGTGAIGIRPFAVWSRGGRISPHVNFGYQWNGSSILGGDVTTGTKDNIPSEFLYSAGLEASVSRHLTTSADLVGQTVVNAQRVHLIPASAPGLCDTFFACANPAPPLQETAIESYKGTYAVNNVALGARYRPFDTFLLSANVLLKLNDGGLRSKAIPTVSATYTFR